ncbi:MAG: hypothetical protein AUG49_15645 [Catenulispora sp. 13_1_20CM_3_70_7]|jgi:hypothetical protein|nr:MAG: hypothetical protein AUG49_15645 [Catenulispora sp. 13_1_20CM_3_70_7]
MTKRSLRRRIIALCSASAAVLATTVAASAPASADSTRTMVLSFSCSTGLPYGLYIDVGSGWYSPPGSSYAVGTTKVFTISIPTSGSYFRYQPSFCDNQPQVPSYPMWEGYTYSLDAGTSTITASGNCADYEFDYYQSRYLLYYCSMGPVTYG